MGNQIRKRPLQVFLGLLFISSFLIMNNVSFFPNVPLAEDRQNDGVEPLNADLQPFDNFTLSGSGDGIPTYLHYNLTNTDAVTRSVRDEISVDTAGNDIGITNFTFNSISASNASYLLELTNNDVQPNIFGNQPTINFTYYQQFFLPADAYLNMASIYVQQAQFLIPFYVNMSVYNATWDFALQTYVPDRMIKPDYWVQADAQADGVDPRIAHWEAFDFSTQHTVINASRTAKMEDLAIFYIGVNIPTNYTPNIFFWYDAEDSFGFGENGGDAWMEIVFPGGPGVDGGEMKHRLLQPLRSHDSSPEFIDFTLVMDFAPVSNTPKPSEVGLKVDGIAVQDLTANTGSYITNQLKHHSGSACRYEVSSAWTDFFVEGNLTFQLEQAYTVQQVIAPDIQYLVDILENVANWNITVFTNYPSQAVVNSPSIEFRLPTNWNVTTLVNWTNGLYDPWTPEKLFWNYTIQEVDYNRTSIMNITTGTWLLNARSPLYVFPTTVNSTFLTSYYYTNISDNLQLSGYVPDGPNGIPIFKRTDTDGEVSDLHVTRGSILNQQDKLATSDDVYLWMLTQNESYRQESIIELNFSLTDTTGMLQNLLNQLNVTIEQFTGNTSKDEELFTNLHTELGDLPQSLQNMYYRDFINGSLKIRVNSSDITPVMFDFNADWLGEVLKEEISGFRVTFVHRLDNAFRLAQESIWAVNVMTGQYEPLDSSCLMVSDVQENPTTMWRFVVWDSALNSKVNIADFIDSADNLIRCRLNSTRPNGVPNGTFDLGIDYIHLTYTFLNPVGAGNLTLSLFNQTLGAFDTPQILPINSQDGVTSLNFPTNVGDYYNVTANNLQLRINLTHWAPSVAAELIDHLYVTLNYSQVLSLNWKQYVVDAYEGLLPTFPETIVTYDNALLNNITFDWDIDSTTLTPGSYSWVTLLSMGSQIAVNTTDVLVKGLPTSILPDDGSGVIFQDGYWVTQPNPYVNDTSKMIRVHVNDTVYGVNLTSITIETPTWSTGQLLVINEFATTGLDEKRGYYTIYLNTTGLGASTLGYNLTLKVSSSIYLSSEINVTVRVDPLPTTIGVIQSSFTVWENETLQIGASFEDTFHTNLVLGASLTWQIVGGTPLQQGSFGQLLYVYEASIDTLAKNIVPGIYSLRIIGTKPNLQDATHDLTLIVLAKNRTILTPDFSALRPNMLGGTVVRVSATLKYQENETAVPTVEVEFVFKVGQDVVKQKAITDANGIASVDFLIPGEATSIGVSANYAGTETIGWTETTATPMYVIVTQTQQIINTLIEYSPYIIAAIGAVVALSLYTRAQHKKLARFWNTRVSKLNDVLNIQHVLVIHKDSGTAILSQSMGTEKIDPNLISGFLTAMTSFQSEIAVKKKEGKEGKKGFLLDYADFKILLEDGEFIRAALILEADASDTIKEALIRFIQRYESRFRKELATWRGNLKELEGGENLIEEVFEMSLIYPHVPNPSINTKKLPKMQKGIYEIAKAITKERPFFFMSRLLEYAIAGRKEPKNQIWSVIYDMKKTHLLEPMTVDHSSQ